MVAEPLAVFAGLKLPHCGLPQVADHVTPAFLLSLLTTAVRLAVAPFATEAGGCGSKLTEIG